MEDKNKKSNKDEKKNNLNKSIDKGEIGLFNLFECNEELVETNKNNHKVEINPTLNLNPNQNHNQNQNTNNNNVKHIEMIKLVDDKKIITENPYVMQLEMEKRKILIN